MRHRTRRGFMTERETPKQTHDPSSRRRLLFSANFSPVNPLKENPSEKDKEISNSGIKTWETKIAELARDQRGRSNPGAVTIAGGGMVVGGVTYLATKVLASENPHHIESANSVPGGTSFNPADGPRLLETKKVKPKEAVKNLNPHPIRAEKFKITPPNRTPSEVIYSQNAPIEQLPVIKEYTEIHPKGVYNNFQPKIKFRLEEQPPVPYTYRSVSLDGVAGPPVETVRPRNPYIEVVGYVIGKQINLDENVFLAIEVPEGENGLINQDDIDKSLLSAKNTTDDGNEGEISSVIVWLEMINVVDYSPPFSFFSSWHESTTARSESEQWTNIPKELFKYIEIGDPIRAWAPPQITPWAQDELTKNYKQNNQAQEEYLSIVNSNAATIKRMVEDAKTGSVTLEEQLDTKRYLLQVDGVRFVPRD